MKKSKKRSSVKISGHKMSITPLRNEYDKDFYKWINEQAKMLKNHEFDKLDIENLVEEIESLGRSEKSKLRSHLIILLMHMLKIEYQPEKHSRSWDLSIINAKYDANETLAENPSLKSKWKEIVASAYHNARVNAAKETGLDLEIFPTECPWDVLKIVRENI